MQLHELNTCSADAFIGALGGIFEHSPWVPAGAAAQRPFADVPALHRAMCAVVARAGEAAQLALIRAHPQLAGKAAVRGELTDSSTREQRGAGLDQCTPEEFAQITRLNDAYQDKFGFPFIIAVRGHTRQSIIAAMESRLPHSIEAETAEALLQIERIAALRLADLVAA
jgi:2-oxo-4-hydroxy-4-carboxy-5-ureidoimidazoline decarboxylase